MSEKKRRIVLVMHSAPLNSGFLMDKWQGLRTRYDLCLLVWDRRHRLRRLPQNGRCVRSGVYDLRSGLENAGQLLALFFRSSAFRRALVRGPWKKALGYWPLFQWRPDQIHFEFGTLARDLSWIQEHFPVPLSVSFRGYDLNYMGLDQKDYYGEVWRKAQGFHFLGEDLLHRARRRGYEDQGVMRRIPPGIPLDLFPTVAPRSPGEKLEIISVGRWVWKKDYGGAIALMARLRDRGLPFRYRLIGEGPEEQKLRFLISEWGLEEQVELLGPLSRPQVAQALQEANLFLHTALSEGFGNALLEAQLMGLPVVATAADGIAENVKDGETGWVVPLGDIDALAERIFWLYHHPQQAMAMGRKGQQRVREAFSLERLLDDFQDFFDQVYARRERN